MHLVEKTSVALPRMTGVAGALRRAEGLLGSIVGAVAALLAGSYRPAPGERVCAIVCGAGTDGID